MKESYDQGIASHIGPESCAEDRKGLSEALTGVRAGRLLSREMVLESRVQTLWT
jgi:RNA-directed DNA polymerase